MKYKLTKGTRIIRRGRDSAKWENFVTTKDAYYDSEEIKPYSEYMRTIEIPLTDGFDTLVVRFNRMIECHLTAEEATNLFNNTDREKNENY